MRACGNELFPDSRSAGFEKNHQPIDSDTKMLAANESESGVSRQFAVVMARVCFLESSACLAPGSGPIRVHQRRGYSTKRRAACASHASRLVKCDVLKVRPDPFESGAAPAFPSVPPTKSGEFAHF